MRKTAIYSIPLVLLLACLFTVGCSDENDSVEPGPVTWKGLEGTVVDGDGEPLEGVAIGIIYDLPLPGAGPDQPLVIVDPAAKPATQISFGLPESGPVRLWITDYAGDFVVTLIDGSVESGDVSVIWQALDENGDPVPSGMYYAHVQIGDEEPTVREIFLLLLDPGEFLRAPNGLTGQYGTFAVTDDLVPVGETIVGVDEHGDPVNEITLSNTLRIVAVREGDPEPVWAQVTIEYVEGENNGGIEFILP